MPAISTPVRSTAQKLQAALPSTCSSTFQRSQPAAFIRPSSNRQMTVYSTSSSSQRRARLEEYHRRMSNVM